MVVSDQSPPSDERAEMALLGDLLRNSTTLHGLDLLQPGHFVDPALGRIFEVIATRVETNLPVDLASLRNAPDLSAALDELGGPSILDQLAALPAPANIAASAERLIDLWQRRSLLALHEQQRRDAEEGITNSLAITSRAPAQQLAQMAVGRAAEWFAIAQAILAPAPRMFAGIPDDISRLVNLLLIEIGELAENHDARAMADEQAGNETFAAARRERAQQLRAFLGEAPA